MSKAAAGPNKTESSSNAAQTTVRTGFFDNSLQELPFVVTPDADNSVECLESWIKENREMLEEKLIRHGALLFRGFKVYEPSQFERIARLIDPELKNNYLGTSPRNGLTDYVFSASELPEYYPVPQHSEMTFTSNSPRRIFFCCLQPSQGEGGETPLVDFRKVYRELSPEVKKRFEEKGIKIIRNYSGPEGGSKFDLWKLKRWDEMFLTTDRAAVEKACRENNFNCTWKPNGRLALISDHQAMKIHPTTGETVWFNHSQVFHLSAAPAEYRRIARRQSDFRYKFLAVFSQAAVFLKKRLIKDEDQALHCTHTDGTQISDADMEHLRDVIWKNMVFFKWEKGDVTAIDNFSVGHGRMPYRGPRNVVVCWA